MIVTRIVLQDYGVYRGKNEFDFTCTAQKPIILIGGTNGAGKTTLFESMTICLYGISALGRRVSKKEYRKFLARKIHRYAKSLTPADHASITVQFKFFHDGKVAEYRVERFWKKEEGSIEETLDVKKRTSDDAEFAPLEDIEKSHWQSFVEGLIPKGIANLFFFDGEKIVEIAKEGTEDIAIKESFKSLLGIDLVEQLRTDLRINLARNLTKKSDHLRQDCDRYEKEKADAMRTIANLEEKSAALQNDMDRLDQEIEVLEGKISGIGGTFASGRDAARGKLAAKKAVYEHVRQDVAELCSGTLPFAMIPDDLVRLSEQIKEDESIQQQLAGDNLVDSKLSHIASKIKTAQFWKESGLERRHIDAAVSAMSSMLRKEKTRAKAVPKPVFDFSASQASRMMSIIDEANTDAISALRKHTKTLVKVAEEMNRLEVSIESAPRDDEISSLVSDIGNAQSQKGELSVRFSHMKEKIASETSLKRHLDNKIQALTSEIYDNEKAEIRVELTQKVQSALEEFAEKLKHKKIRLLEGYVLGYLKLLMHKKNLVEKVVVNPDTFEITLFRENGSTLQKDILSEGEKQMFAMSVLWSLAKTSGRPLPFVIDTPLARLDGKHRTNIMAKFLPKASHQILIFSTDKEIEYRDYKKLKPHLMRSYALEYVDSKGSTKKHDSYFWNEGGRRVVAVR